MRGFKNKKAVAWIVMLVFLFTCVMPSGTALAGVTETNAQIVKHGETSYYLKGQNGTSNNNDVQISKMITATENENEFDIELKVITKENLQELMTLKREAAVVMVIDTSGSMLWGEDVRYQVSAEQQRLTAAKTVAKEFVTNYANSFTDKALFSLVSFNKGAAAQQISGNYWVDLAAGTADAAKSSIDGLSTSTGTNIAAGLRVAKNLLNNLPSDAPSTRYVILLTDGEPNRQITADNGYTVSGGNSVGTTSGRAAANTEAAALKALSIVPTIYTVGFSTDVENAETFLSGVATSANHYSYAATSADLEATFKIITESITLLANAWQVTDPMGTDVLGSESIQLGENIQFLGFYNASGALQNSPLTNELGEYSKVVDVDGVDTIDWNLKITGAQEIAAGTYEYSLKYKVRLDTTASGFEAGKAYDTNGTTELVYVIQQENSDLIDGPYTVAFEVPQVKGYKGNVEFKKTDDNGNALAGAQFTLALKANANHNHGGDYNATATSDANGIVKFENVPSGHSYTLTEIVAPVGYIQAAAQDVTVSYGKLIGADGNELNAIANVYNRTSVAVEKDWNDNNNQDGKRPASIIVKLFANGDEKGQVTLNESNGWTHTFDNLTKYSNGEEIEYTVDEAAVPNGYSKAVTGSAAEGFVITNAYVPETINISGTKDWNDNNNQDGMRPESITVNLLADGVEVDEVIVTANDGWAYSFTNLDKYADGEEIEYTITEDAVEGYTAVINGYDIVNTHEVAKVEVEGQKSWNDNNNQDGMRPESITVNLLADGVEVDEVEVTAANNWAYSFTNLDKYADGKEIVYTITEDAVAGYETKINGYDIVNTHEVAKVKVEGQKSWNDNNNQDGMRPESITVNLLADGVEVDEVEVSAANNWAYSFTNLDKYADGEEIEYTITEDAVEGYTAVINGYDIVNTHEVAKVKVEGQKSWNDNNNQDGMRPESITVNLLADGVEVDEAEVSAANNWAYSFTNLDKYADGEEIEYTITEDAVEGYTAVINGYDIVNTHEVAKVKVEGQKSWNDNNNQDGMRPESITVNLLADGVEVDEVEVTAANNWAYSFTNLDKYADGKEIEYTITEDAVEGYTAVVNGYDIVNTHEVAKVKVEGQKSWEDNNNQDGMRPESITVNLLADGVEVAEAEVSAADNWAYSFTNLDKYADGKEIVYTITEDAVAGYETTINGYDIVNTHEVAKVKVEGQKTWNDNNNQDGMRPESITVNLLADGVEVDEVEVTAANNWAYSFINLDKYADGKEIVYTITEDAVAGYETTINGYDIVNTHEVAKVKVAVEKVWNDGSDAEGFRPDSITVKLLADGVEKAAATLNESNGWAYEFTGLDKFKAGKEIAYTVEEVAVAGYTVAITGDAADGYTITNTREVNFTSVTVNKVWDDASNQDGARPESIEVQLNANGNAAATVVLNESNDWTYTFTDLAVYANGREIVYTVDELNVPDGYTKSVDGYTITNAYTPEITNVSGTKYWVDNNNEAGKRPGEIIVELYANGVYEDEARVTDFDDWKYEFNNLPRYENGVEIEYTIKEVPVANYTTVYNGFNITNTIEQKYFDISGTKTWIAPEGIEHPEIVIDLFRDGEKFREVTLAPGTVEYKFENLESYDLTDGHMYQYQLAERKVDGYVPSYEMTVDGKDRIIDITNTYTGEEEQFVTISGEKKWVAPEGTVLPASVTINLYQNGTRIDSMEVTEEMNWQYSFDNLAMYDEDGVAYSYTVKEVPVDGYLSLVVPTANGYDITNTLYVGEAGQFSVSKTVSGGDQMVPADDTEYSFLLKVKATVNEWDSMKVYQKSELEDAYDEAVKELDEANAKLARAERLFRQNAVAFTTGSAYQFIMVEEVYIEEPEVTTGSAYEYTTGSAYKYTIVDNDGDIRVKHNETPLFNSFTPAADAADAITRIIDAIKALADDFKNLNKASVFLNMLNEEQQSSTPSALKFNRTDAEDLLQAERDVREADALVAATEQAIDDFIAADVTTPSAIKITMTPTAGSGLEAVVMELDTDSALYDAETMTYAINFELLKDTGYVFTIEAADKAEIEYSISEIDWAFENYVGTEITVNGIEELDGRYVAPREMDKASADTYLFNNIYEDNPPPPPPPPTEPDPKPDPDPYVPPYVPPVIPDEPEVPEEPVVIEEPEVPLVDIPGEIIEEEDIPLGDAPPTGDNANAVPFMMMMVLAAAGLVITRKRFS